MDDLTRDILEHLEYIQSTIDALGESTDDIQQQIAKLLQDQISSFEITGGRFVAGQDLRARIMAVEQRFNDILSSKTYVDSIREYLKSFSTIADTTAMLHRNYNELDIDATLLAPARKVIYDQAKEALLGSGISSIYEEPVKHMLIQQVTTGGTISDMEKIIQRWSAGDLSGSHSPTGQPIPSLNQYATQLARDTSYQFNGTVNEIIRQEYDLDGFTYVGDVIRDSRPLCVHLVNMRREISRDELSKLLEKPELKPGRIPNTTVDNFCTYRGGYGCRHQAFPVRIKK